jgi:glutamine synthetase
MAKPSERDIGSSCHIHSSLLDAEGGKSALVDEGGEENDTFRHYLGGMRRHIRELALFVAPAINSYKRFASESWAPTSVSWGRDNRTCGFRIVGHGPSRRVECRIPGADVNPYLGIAALLAAGLDGIENGIDPGDPSEGSMYETSVEDRKKMGIETLPENLLDATRELEQDQVLRKALGTVRDGDYVDYFISCKRREWQQAHEQITKWEIDRYLQLF